jgi:hypothetical protein
MSLSNISPRSMVVPARKVEVYTLEQLKTIAPKVFKRKYEIFCNSEMECGAPWNDEVMDSLKAIIKAAGYRLTDWNVSSSNYSYIKLSSNDNIDDLSGARAFAWLENKILSKHRIPWLPFTNAKRREYAATLKAYSPCHPAGKRHFYAPGCVNPCPFTGYCGDESFLDDLKDSIRAGMSVRESLLALARCAQKQFEDNEEQATSEENFLASEEGALFTECGGEV